jgi:hypothetical protein
MSKFALCVLLTGALVACSKSKESATTAGSAMTGSAVESGSAAAGPGSAAMAGSAAAGSAGGSGSAAAESGSAAEGSGSAAAESGSAAEGSGSAAEGSGSAAEADDDDDEHASGGFDFDKLSHEEKMKFMKTKVMPTMKAAYRKFDPVKFAKFGCKTCHGKHAKANKYKMPNPGLPKIDFAALKLGKQKPKTAKFMTEVVRPTMAKLLQEPEMSAQHPHGFGCLDCHEAKK